MPSTFRALSLALALIATGGGPLAAQHTSDAPPDDRAVPLYAAGLGDLTRRVDTVEPEAQAYFDQGLQLMYAFAVEEGRRSFAAAREHDPACAMCAWGEAWGWGSYLNGPMGPDDEAPAHSAATRALELARAGRTSPVERALIEAMAVRYSPTPDGDGRAARDSTYARAMEEVYAGFPDDLEVGTLTAEALMLLEPRRGTWPLDKPSVRRIHQVLEETLARDVSHPGACHLYVHATESTPAAGKAEPCADLLGGSIPGASHINHMPSHTYSRIGRWGDAVRANQQAWHSDQKAAIGEGFAIYPSHNLHMLLFAASMDGQSAVAVQAGKDYGRLVPGGQFYHALALLRFGRFDEILELEEPPVDPLHRGLWRFARGYAHLRSGSADSARAAVDGLADLVAERGDSIQFRGHTGTELLGVTGGILEAEVLREEGRTDDAIAVLERAVEVEDGLRYDEPEPLNFSARHWLGAALLEEGRAVEAEAVYRAALDDHPKNGWSLYGLAQALRAQERFGDAVLVERELASAWARADVWIRASRF
jgi:tetratricopeptide (TPR) repeat protein